MKSQDWQDGYATAFVYLSDVFESRTQAFYSRNLLRKKDIKFVVNVIDACLRARDKLAEVGPRGMDLVIHKNGNVEFIERQKGTE